MHENMNKFQEENLENIRRVVERGIQFNQDLMLDNYNDSLSRNIDILNHILNLLELIKNNNENT